MQRELISPSLSDRQARLIIENAVDYGIVGLDLEGVITSWNVGAERIMGWAPDQAIGHSARMFFTPEDVAARVPEAEMTGAVQDGRGIDERWHLRKDGTRFWANGELLPLRNEASELEGYVKILRDRTSQHLAEEELVQADRLRHGLVELSERLRLIEDVAEMQIAAAEVIGSAVAVARVGYGSVADDQQTFTVPNDWTKAGFPSLAGVYKLDDYGLYANDLRAGEMMSSRNRAPLGRSMSGRTLPGSVTISVPACSDRDHPYASRWMPSRSRSVPIMPCRSDCWSMSLRPTPSNMPFQKERGSSRSGFASGTVR